MKIKKAVIPIAGKGTRLLPATKQIPKEMIPVVDRPIIHYAVEEAVQSGIEQIIFVTSREKEVVENYFDRNRELETFLKEKNKNQYLDIVSNVARMADIVTIRQKEPLGLGHAILRTRDIIANEPFAVILPDDITLAEKPVTRQLMDVSFSRDNASVIGVMEVKKEEIHRYGVISGDFLNKSTQTLSVKSMVEKPRKNPPSNLATPGRYILHPAIFDYLDQIDPGSGGEYQLTDAINLLSQNYPVLAHIFIGDRFDTGNIPGLLNANIELALRRPEIKEDMIRIIKDKISRYNL
ncbi:MAG: UTP--glucose-1-phosphate uridylyltransferase [Halobacteriovoraceae bacterium]|nr:UTP--glucose-1-phosphate uridylyltransferase [Halobacteriovoraceae bacterium]